MKNFIVKYKSNMGVVYLCKYHVIWCPKFRRPVLVDGVDVRLMDIIRSVATEYNAEILELKIMPDHVHLLVEVDPQFGIHKLVKLMKSRSSCSIRSEFGWIKSRLPTLWSNSYFVSTIGVVAPEVVLQYIEQQKHK